MNYTQRLTILRCFLRRNNCVVNCKTRFSSNIAQEQDPWTIRRTVFATCRGRFPSKPLGVDYEVAYLDSGADWHYTKKKTSPVVLAVHGLPADHDDMLPVVSPLHNDGCRVIVVNLPGYQLTTPLRKDEEDLYSQSTADVTEFLLNFLTSLQIKKVDLVVAHSAGVLPSVVLSGMTDYIRSLLLICSFPGHKRPRSSMPQLLWAYQVVIKMFSSPLGRRFVSPLVRAINRYSVNFRGEPEHFVNTLKFVANINFDLLSTTALDGEIKGIPMVFAFSKNDKVMAFDENIEWAKILGLEETQMDEYDKEFKLCKEAGRDLDPYRKGLIFHAGGHFPQFKTDTALPILVKEAQVLLQKTSQKDSIVPPIRKTN